MISWIQTALQKHHRLFFVLLLAVVIVSFVIYFAPGVGFGIPGGARAMNRPFFGMNLGSQEDQQRMFGDASLSVFLQAGYSALDQAQMQDYALQRQAGLHLADQLNLPGPTDDQLGDFIQTLGAFSGPTGGFDPQAYANFRDNLKTNPQLREEDITRVINDDFRFNRVQELLAGPGYVLPSDVKEQLTRTESTWTVAVASVDFAAFNPAITPTDAQLTEFFETNKFRYEIPPRVKVRYAEFPASSFVDQVSLTEEQVRDYYDANPLRFPNPAAAAAGAAPTVGTENTADTNFAAVRTQVEQALRLEQAQRLAATAASDLSLALFENKVSPDQVDSFLSARGIALREAPAFTAQNVPAELGGSPVVAEQAFKLNAERYYSDALPIQAGSIVLFWQETVPAREPQFNEVRDQVAADFVTEEKRRQFVALGNTLREALAARVKAGESFDQAVNAVAAEHAVTMTSTAYPAFTLRQPPPDINYAALSALEEAEPGTVSEMIMSGNEGLLLHTVDRQLPDLTEGNPQYVSTRDQLAQFTSAQNASSYLRQLVQAELMRTAPETAVAP